jgi:hypothetical protein
MAYKSLAYFRGTMVHYEEYTSPGSYTFTKPANVDWIEVLLVAGGGSGARGRDQYNGAGGGGGGEIVKRTIKITGDVTVTIGAGGSPATSDGSAGSNGGNSTLSGGASLTAFGGEKGYVSMGGHGGGADTNEGYKIGLGGRHAPNSDVDAGIESWGGIGGQPGAGGGCGYDQSEGWSDADGGGCLGFGQGGSNGLYAGGGGGSFGSGGDGGSSPTTAGIGGGGGGGRHGYNSGAGGDGYCLITWMV